MRLAGNFGNIEEAIERLTIHLRSHSLQFFGLLLRKFSIAFIFYYARIDGDRLSLVKRFSEGPRLESFFLLFCAGFSWRSLLPFCIKVH